MSRLNLVKFINLSAPNMGYLWLTTRCISTCFTGMSTATCGPWTPCAERDRHLKRDLCNNPRLIFTTSARTACIRGLIRVIKQQDGDDGINTSGLNSSKHFSIIQNLRSFSSTSSKELLKDKFEYEKHEQQDKNKALKDIKTSKRKFGPHEYEFDDNGYLSVDDIVKFLRHEAAYDICVIKTSGVKTAYVDYFIVVSGVSNRHIRAMSKNLEQLFRGHSVRGISKNGHVTVEGLESDSSWLAVDIGNMVVHFFLPEVREIYELEKLWTLGPKYDDQYRALQEEEEFLQAVFLGEQKKSTDVDD